MVYLQLKGKVKIKLRLVVSINVQEQMVQKGNQTIFAVDQLGNLVIISSNFIALFL